MTYFDNWEEGRKEELAKDFRIQVGEIQDCEILFASYTGAWIEGFAFVLFKKDGKLFEVNASHCSCHGLEGQWEPEETMVSALRVRDWSRVYCIDETNSQSLMDLLNKLECEGF